MCNGEIVIILQKGCGSGILAWHRVAICYGPIGIGRPLGH